MKGFTFCVLSYNHENYIVEHLESIKYLISNYGENIDFEIIISDDASKDNTKKLVNAWIKKNTKLFSRVIRIFNKVNLGTCACVVNIFAHIESDCFKLTAGDDVYSCENIFLAVMERYPNFDILSGLPLILRSNQLAFSGSLVFNVISSYFLYLGMTVYDRVRNFGVYNAPSIFYNAKYSKNSHVIEFVSKFDVVEDFPLQIAIGESEVSAKYFLDPVVYVYYRRTSGSTYMVVSERFIRDQVALFQHLINTESSFFRKILLRNRLFCFRIGRNPIRRFLNVSIFLHFLKIFLNILPISFLYFRVRRKGVEKYHQHYALIRMRAKEFLNDL